MNTIVSKLNARFTYRADPKFWDSWKFMSQTDDKVFGDCEDYSLYIAREVLGGTNRGFMMGLLQGKVEFWFVRTSGGGGHCVLVMGDKAIDNWSRAWIPVSSMRGIHTFKHRYSVAMVLLKLIAGKIY